METITFTLPKGLLVGALPLIEQALNDMGNAGCNDYYLPDTPEMRELLQKIQLQQCGESWDIKGRDGKLCCQDFMVLGYFKHLLEQTGQ